MVRAMAGKQRRSDVEWSDIRAAYVEGRPGRTAEDPPYWPTLEEVARAFKLGHDTVRKRAGLEDWGRQRSVYAEQLNRRRREVRAAALVKEAASFDSHSLLLAKAIQGNVAATLQDIAVRRQTRATLIKAARSATQVAAIMADPKHNPVEPGELGRLAQALVHSQRVGRLALGDATDYVDSKVENTVSGTVQHEGEVKHQHAHVHDLAADPERLAMVAKVLREAGLG